MSETLWQRWQVLAERDPEREAIVHVCAGEPAVRIGRAQLLQSAERVAAQLAACGVQPRDVCALIVRHHPKFYALYAGVIALGAVPAVLAYPNPRLHRDKFVRGLSGMAQRSGLRFVLTERELETAIVPLLASAACSVRAVLFPLEWPAEDSPAMNHHLPPTAADAPCLLQHSSGTTGLQKAVVLTHRAVLAHVERYAEAIALSARDKVVSWLPLYHDMGLIAAFHLPLARGIPLVQLDPFEWIMAPVLLLEALASERATLAWLPNFAYNFMADRIRDDDLAGLDLGSVRMLINCSEPVRASSHQKFFERFASLGLSERTLSVAYAMAETTFAVTQTPPGERARELRVSRSALERGAVVPDDCGDARACVSCGTPIRDCAVRVLDAAGEVLPELCVGELWIGSCSLFDGYHNDPARTAEVLQDGWYKSGDLGFLSQGEVFVIGRKNDLIIIAGKNLSPEDIEDACADVPGLIAGRIVAFGLDDEAGGTESVCVVAETETHDPRARDALRLAVIKAAMAIDVTVQRVELAPPRWLVKSSSGKLSRHENRVRLLAGALDHKTAMETSSL
jgi:acyl-CoA synthetase (AMP-forming)/AMP-acid ligase II